MKKGCEGKEKKTQRRNLPVLSSSAAEKGEISASGAARWRAFALITLNVLMAAHVIQWLMMGRTVSPIEPSEAMYTLQRGAVNAGFIFFILAITATLVFGRFVCGWGCHIVSLQDFCGWLLKKMGLKPKPFRSRLLIFVPLIVALYMFVWPTFVRWLALPKNEPLIPQFTNHLIIENFWATFPPIAVAIPFLFICGFMTVYFLGQKGFCAYACPYGGFFGVADKLAPGKIRVTDDCNQCGHCTAACTSNVLVHAEVKEYGMVVDPGCMKCLDCVSVCPNDALYFGFGKPALLVKQTLNKNYSLTWPEDIAAALIFAVSFFAVWDVYQLVPMLMALGIACVSTVLLVKTWQMFRRKDTAFYRFTLRSAGSIKPAGWAFLSFTLLWVGLNAHSGWVRYHESVGAAAYEAVRIPDELALAQADPAQWLSAADRQNIAAGAQHLNAAQNVGFFTNVFALSKLAWLEYLSGNIGRALELLERSATVQPAQNRALSLYYRGAILNRLGRPEEALANLDAALSERANLALAREERGEALWKLGRQQEALKAWGDAAQANKGLVIANYMLAGALAATDKPEPAALYEKQAFQLTPNDPYFLWMLGLRLKNIGMDELAEKQFQRAIALNPQFQTRQK
jgi:polyferredoxin/Flp pilus assembly protein TadD